MRPISKLLIANRGEIALRIQQSARAMGISTVAVYSDADAAAPFVRAADEAVRLGPAPSADSYLRIDRILEAAQRTGADAVHPGFGFLAENADFARACQKAGLSFVGPSPEAIASMGSKKAAKRLVAGAGVPVVPGAEPDDQATESIAKHARAVGYPLLLKASAGGGGKGMRVVHRDADLEPAIEGAKREAKSAFGDDTLLIEKYIERPRHVEVQILGDRHGNLVHLFERECSIQRRHQKIIEESPSPALTDALRATMGAAAVSVGKAVGYENAGTVEFILGQDGSFYFLEVNTRLQVEHPITECVTGIDIVREQLLVAQGEALSFRQADLAQRGHAVECRLYAEDADNHFLPTTGTLVDWQVPDMPGLRVDSGVETGSEVGIHYDPMLAKVITHAPSRGEAIQKMIGALAGLSAEGLVTNREFLLRVLTHPEFRAGATHTHFIEQHLAEKPDDPTRPERERWAAVAATLSGRDQRLQARDVLPGLAPGFRNNPGSREWVEYRLADRHVRVQYATLGKGTLAVSFDGSEHVVREASVDGAAVSFEDDAGVRRSFRVTRRADHFYVHARSGSFTLVELPRFPEKQAAAAPGACVAPMPGKVVKVVALEGTAVSAGDVLVVLEAMKMEHSVKAPEAGIVKQLLVSEGEQVEAAAVLAVVGTPD
ncbi:MAG: acetyl-CoA carboxylase biotin carboxylase subunit [Myxococcales bacterium]|nr:acetyl-CoA carboxylase biotin carboxylase subunit [Myxococcales bacterium]